MLKLAKNQMASVIESVKDESSAQAALPKIISITVKLAELSKTMKDMKITKAEDARFKIKYEGQIRDSGIRIGKALLNIGRIGVKDPAFRDAVMKIQPSLAH